MSAARTRLAALAAAAGYPADLLCQIASATLPAYQPGDTLSDTQILHVAHAVEVLAAAGHDTAAVDALIARHRDSSGERWRDALWAEALRDANARHRRPAAPAPAGT